MSILGAALIVTAFICVLFAVAYQLDAYEARYQARLEERAREWKASERGSASVVDFENYLHNREQGDEPAQEERHHG